MDKPPRSVVQVRFTGVRCPARHLRPAWPHELQYEPAAGMPVRVYLPPLVPQVACGSPFVWCMVEEDVQRLCGTLPLRGQVIVCAHEVDVD